MDRFTAIVLSAGQGRRMNSEVAKQYMTLEGKPILYYSLKVFEESDVDDILLVVGAGDEAYVKETIVNRYNFTKVSRIITGGQERYDSVYQGLLAAENADYVLIHDAARPLVTSQIIARAMDNAKEYKACVIGVPSKDTVKIADEDQMVAKTPNREAVWLVQTPQAFSYSLIREAYDRLMMDRTGIITDDAMVVERFMGQKVRLVKGSYTNIKITTPEDILMAEVYLKELPEMIQIY